MAPPQLSRARRWAFHLAACILVLVTAVVMLIAADVYTHRRLAQYAAVNEWGYRGPVVGRKASGERRVLVIGGSTAFGVGFSAAQAFPAQLESRLRAIEPFPVSVVNLGFPGEDAYAYKAVLEDYRYLEPDAVVFYGDNNVLGGATPIVLRRLSVVFRYTGYYPILPTALREKAMAIEYGGDVGAAYRGDKVVFRPGLAARTGASALAEAASVADRIHQVLGRLTFAEETPLLAPNGCGEWLQFCNAIERAVAYTRSLGLPVLVVNHPYLSDRHVLAQQALQGMLREKFGADAGVRYLDLGWAVDVRDPALAFDGDHLTPAGNARIADRLTEPVRAMLDVKTAYR